MASRSSGIAATSIASAASVSRRIRSSSRTPSITVASGHDVGSTEATRTSAHGVDGVSEAAEWVEYAERFGADAGRIARVVFFSTVGAFVTFTAVVAWVDAAGIAAPLAPGAR